MNTPETPMKKLLNNEVIIPASPFMKCLGFGSGVSVYKLNRSPICTQARSPWAIKKLRRLKSTDEKRSRLKKEAEILRKLNHPNIIGFRAVTKDKQGEMCLAMEACKVSLGDLIEERSKEGLLAFPALSIAKVSDGISKALNYLHNKVYILHCDIKSYNILINDNFDDCKLCDFGISLPLKSDGTVSSEYLTEDTCLGTGPWMSPEANLYSIVTAKSDIYSFGLVIWEMIALTVPPENNDENNLSMNTPSLNGTNLKKLSASDEDSYLSEEISDLDDSFTSSFESDPQTKLRNINWRPELPAQEFSKCYDHILELFYCCTEREPEFRPNAELLQKVSKDILEGLLKN